LYDFYDHLNQLTRDNDTNYTYDKNGNRTNPGYQTNPDNRLQSDGAVTYGYDGEGNVTQTTNLAGTQRWTYQYDNRNRMTSALQQNLMNGTWVNNIQAT
jgi:YD repeat-containing protein